jgi:hypothetical protein
LRAGTAAFFFKPAFFGGDFAFGAAFLEAAFFAALLRPRTVLAMSIPPNA